MRLSLLLSHQYESFCESMNFDNFVYNKNRPSHSFFLYHGIKKVRAKSEVSRTIFSIAASIIKKIYHCKIYYIFRCS